MEENNFLKEEHINKGVSFGRIFDIVSIAAGAISGMWILIFGFGFISEIITHKFFSPNSPIIWGYNNNLGVPFGVDLESAVRHFYLKDKTFGYFFIGVLPYLALILNCLALAYYISRKKIKRIVLFILLTIPLIAIILIKPLDYVQKHL